MHPDHPEDGLFENKTGWAETYGRQGDTPGDRKWENSRKKKAGDARRLMPGKVESGDPGEDGQEGGRFFCFQRPWTSRNSSCSFWSSARVFLSSNLGVGLLKRHQRKIGVKRLWEMEAERVAGLLCPGTP